MTGKEKHKCPPHHFNIGPDNIGRCIHCPEIRDYTKLQEREVRRLRRIYGRNTVAFMGVSEALRQQRKPIKTGDRR